MQMKSYPFPIHIGELNHTPVGDLRLAASDRGLLAVEWAHSQLDFDSYLLVSEPGTVAPYADQLQEYFEGKRHEFTFPIDWSIFRPFQKEALQRVFKIPYGRHAPMPISLWRWTVRAPIAPWGAPMPPTPCPSSSPVTA